MFSSFCDKICDRFVSMNVIAEERKPLYVYGLNQAITMCLNIVTTLLLGRLFDMLWYCVAFLAAFIPIRSYAGGYHAKTPLRCYVFSVVQIIIVLSLLKYIDISFWIAVGIVILSGIFILFLSPMEDPNKPFSNGEFIAFRKRARIIWIFELFFYIVCALLQWHVICLSIMIAHATLAVVLLLGFIKNKYQLKKSCE